MMVRTFVSAMIVAAALSQASNAEDTLIEKIRAASEQREKGYTVRGDLSVESDGQVRLQFTKDAYCLMAAKHLDQDRIFPLAKGEDPSGRNSEFSVKILKGAEIELHVGDLVHKFVIDDGQRPFYIDPVEQKVIYLDSPDEKKKALNCPYKCKKYVNVVDVYCCGNGFAHGGFGYVGCSDDWCDKPKCCE